MKPIWSIFAGGLILTLTGGAEAAIEQPALPRVVQPVVKSPSAVVFKPATSPMSRDELLLRLRALKEDKDKNRPRR